MFEETLCSFQVSILSAGAGGETEAVSFFFLPFLFGFLKITGLCNSGSVSELGSQAGVQGQGLQHPFALGRPGRRESRGAEWRERTFDLSPRERLRHQH